MSLLWLFFDLTTLYRAVNHPAKIAIFFENIYVIFNLSIYL